MDNVSLVSLRGLYSLTSIHGFMNISNNDALISLEGLNNLITIGGELSIKDNPVLKSLESLSNLTTVGSRFLIQRNNSLNNIGLVSLCSVGASYYVNDYYDVFFNKELCTFLAEDLADQIQSCDGIAGRVDISSNKICP